MHHTNHPAHTDAINPARRADDALPYVNDPTAMTVEQLAPLLRAWAAGLYPAEAGVELLIAHRTWLQRRDFILALVDTIDEGWGPGGTVIPMASIDWDRVQAFLTATYGSTSEINILRIAASLAGATIPTSLLVMTASLDTTNAALVLDALAHRYGWHEHGTTHTTTGHLTHSETSA